MSAQTDRERLAELERAVRGYSLEDLHQRNAEAYPGAWERVTAFIAAWDIHRVTIAEAGDATLSLDDLLTVLNVRLDETHSANETKETK